MILLRTLLNELQLVKQGKSYENAEKGLFPIVGRIGDKIWEKERVRGFHYTKPANITKLKGLQGKRNALSISTEVRPNYVEAIMGPVSRGLGVWVEGDVLLKSPRDLGSTPDENGRRWIDLQKIDNKMASEFGHYLRSSIEYAFAHKKVKNTLSAFNKWLDDPPFHDRLLLKSEKDKLLKDLGNAKSEFVKLHLDLSWSWLMSGDVLKQFREAIVNQSDLVVRGTNNNEYIVTNIKLIDAIIYDLERPKDWDRRPNKDEVEWAYEKNKKEIKSAISGQLIIAPHPNNPRYDNGNTAKKFYNDRKDWNK